MIRSSEEHEAAEKKSFADGDGKQRGPSAAEAAKVAAAEQAITLLVPADRVDSLVEHIEAKTGQSLIVVRTGDQTLLLSPQVANQRTPARKELDKIEKSAAPLADAAAEIEPSPGPIQPKLDAAPAAPPSVIAPSDKALADSKDVKPQAKNAAARQVVVKIILAEEAK